LRDQETLAQLPSRFTVNSPQITVGKRPLLEAAASLFDSVGRPRKETKGEGGEVSMEALYEQIGRLQRDQEWLKKK
jgi:hypothetical protein